MTGRKVGKGQVTKIQEQKMRDRAQSIEKNTARSGIIKHTLYPVVGVIMVL